MLLELNVHLGKMFEVIAVHDEEIDSLDHVGQLVEVSSHLGNHKIDFLFVLSSELMVGNDSHTSANCREFVTKTFELLGENHVADFGPLIMEDTELFFIIWEVLSSEVHGQSKTVVSSL